MWYQPLVLKFPFWLPKHGDYTPEHFGVDRFSRIPSQQNVLVVMNNWLWRLSRAGGARSHGARERARWLQNAGQSVRRRHIQNTRQRFALRDETFEPRISILAPGLGLAYHNPPSLDPPKRSSFSG